MGRPNATGRSTSDPHVRLHAWMTNRPAWKALSGNSIKVLVYVASYDDGKNNGAIFMSERRASDGTGLDRKTVRKALLELQRLGFLFRVARGSFRLKRSPAAQWRLTWKSAPALSMKATHDYRSLTEEKIRRGELLPVAGPVSPPPPANEPLGGPDFPHAEKANSQFSANPDLGDIGPQIIATVDGQPDCFRHVISEWWRTSRSRDRIKMANRHDVTAGELSSFVAGETDLAFPKQVAIRHDIIGLTGKEAA